MTRRDTGRQETKTEGVTGRQRETEIYEDVKDRGQRETEGDRGDRGR